MKDFENLRYFVKILRFRFFFEFWSVFYLKFASPYRPQNAAESFSHACKVICEWRTTSGCHLRIVSGALEVSKLFLVLPQIWRKMAKIRFWVNFFQNSVDANLNLPVQACSEYCQVLGDGSLVSKDDFAPTLDLFEQKLASMNVCKKIWKISKNREICGFLQISVNFLQNSVDAKLNPPVQAFSEYNQVLGDASLVSRDDFAPTLDLFEQKLASVNFRENLQKSKKSRFWAIFSKNSVDANLNLVVKIVSM